MDARPRMNKKKIFLIWTLVGVAVPIFWGALAFLTFNAPQSKWTDAFWNTVYITCPPWLLPESQYQWISSIDTPLVNGLLYGAIAVAISSLRRK